MTAPPPPCLWCGEPVGEGRETDGANVWHTTCPDSTPRHDVVLSDAALKEACARCLAPAGTVCMDLERGVRDPTRVCLARVWRAIERDFPERIDERGFLRTTGAAP